LPRSGVAGHHPLLLGVAGDPIPLPEYDYAGAVRERPVKVITEEITGLPIPAESEIVMVGSCPPGETRLEGPFGNGQATPAASGKRTS